MLLDRVFNFSKEYPGMIPFYYDIGSFILRGVMWYTVRIDVHTRHSLKILLAWFRGKMFLTGLSTREVGGH